GALGYDQPVAVRVQEGFVFLGDRHLKTTPQVMPIFASFIDALVAVGVGSLILRRTATDPDLRRFAELFVATQPGEFDKLRTGLTAAAIESISVEMPRTTRKAEVA